MAHCSRPACRAEPIAAVAGRIAESGDRDGEFGALSRVEWARQLLPQSLATPQGWSLLAAPKTLALATTGGGIPAHVSRTLPPALFGTTLHFQARTQSSVAPAGEAYSNSLSITLVP